MLLNQPLFSLNAHHVRKKMVQTHFNHLISNVPKHVVEIYEIKKKQEPKPNVPTPNHVLFEFNTQKKTLEPEIEPESTMKLPLENDNIVEYVVDDYIDMGNIYNSEFENIEYNPMNFSLRHYISSK